MKIVLLLSSIAVVLFSGLYLYQENVLPEWRMQQQAYLDRIERKQDSKAGLTAATFSFDIGLKQIWLPHMNRADRCISCHVAIEDPNFKHEPNPLNVHPNGYREAHDPEKYGCTICHDGQGRAITREEAAADDPDFFWDKPLLRKPFIEANCYRCHTDNLDQTPAYNRGKQKFETSGCLGCHQRAGKGGFIGPELVGIGDASTHVKFPQKSLDIQILTQLNNNQNLGYIYEAVRFPGAQPGTSLMFDFKLSHEAAIELTVYLKSLAIQQPGTHKLPPGPTYLLPIAERGNRLFERYCTACHGKNGRGGVKNANYINEFIPRLNTLAERMFLYKKDTQETIIAILDEYEDLLKAGSQPDIPAFFKVVAKYMPVKNIILNGRGVERKEPKGAAPLNMPAWGETLSDTDVSAVIAYLISVY